MTVVRYITTYCRKNGITPISIQKIEQIQLEDTCENHIAEMWLQAYLKQNKEKEPKM